MPHDLPAWVAELTDPRRARTLDELADRLVPLAEHAIDVSRRLQGLLNELNEPFQREALHERVERLKARTGEAFGEVSEEIAASGRERVARIHAACEERAAGPVAQQAARRAAELRDRLEEEVGPLIVRQQRAAAGQVRQRAGTALDEAVRQLLGRVEELAEAVTDLIHEVLPLAREGLELAGRISGLSGRARSAGHGPIPAELAAEAAETAAAFDEAVGRLELEWSALGARGATVRAALRAAEETAFSQITAEMTRCVAELAPGHARALGEAEARAMTLLGELTGGSSSA
ncbi:hypothetical protein SAMN04489712_102216 [Thermomonospora echinospora]|uniref:Uncharacterized protein n=1 Tax=Thermomonospora echinospora TaxID=1992 RepID=A0A1H5VB86_9ACTN|nr:hypothetical protein [Thermomonospora echinospora]SEF83707.1 hypothetical protein SAMN04489712_102216 [Thermomonospora echinospora]